MSDEQGGVVPIQHEDFGILLAEVRHVRDQVAASQQILGEQVQETRDLNRRVEIQNGRTGKLEQWMVGHQREHDTAAAKRQAIEEVRARAVLTGTQIVKLAGASGGAAAAVWAVLQKVAG